MDLFSDLLPKQAATTFVALAVTLQNILLAIFPIFFGKFNKNRDFAGYQKSLYFLCGMATVCTLLSSTACFWDFKTNKILHLPENSKEVKELKIRKMEDFEFRKRETGTYRSMQNTTLNSRVKSGMDTTFSTQQQKTVEFDKIKVV